jgi:nitrogen regulatory protein PII
MRLILAVIQPTKLKAVQQALARIGVERMTVCDAQGYGQQRGPSEPPRRGEANLLRKVALEIVVNEDFVDRTVETIHEVARSGPEGSLDDGEIFILPTEETVRMQDLVRGPEAVS